MKNYSWYQVDVIVDGRTLTGFPDAKTIIRATRNAPQHQQVIDSRGKGTVITSANFSGKIVLPLLQTSDDCAVLSTRAALTHELGTSGNAGNILLSQIFIKDKMGGTLVTGINGTIDIIPGLDRGTGLAVENYTFSVERLIFVRNTYDDIGV